MICIHNAYCIRTGSQIRECKRYIFTHFISIVHNRCRLIRIHEFEFIVRCTTIGHDNRNRTRCFAVAENRRTAEGCFNIGRSIHLDLRNLERAGREVLAHIAYPNLVVAFRQAGEFRRSLIGQVGCLRRKSYSVFIGSLFESTGYGVHRNLAVGSTRSSHSGRCCATGDFRCLFNGNRLAVRTVAVRNGHRVRTARQTGERSAHLSVVPGEGIEFLSCTAGCGSRNGSVVHGAAVSIRCRSRYLQFLRFTDFHVDGYRTFVLILDDYGVRTHSERRIGSPGNAAAPVERIFTRTARCGQRSRTVRLTLALRIRLAYDRRFDLGRILNGDAVALLATVLIDYGHGIGTRQQACSRLFAADRFVVIILPGIGLIWIGAALNVNRSGSGCRIVAACCRLRHRQFHFGCLAHGDCLRSRTGVAVQYVHRIGTLRNIRDGSLVAANRVVGAVGPCIVVSGTFRTAFHGDGSLTHRFAVAERCHGRHRQFQCIRFGHFLRILSRAVVTVEDRNLVVTCLQAVHSRIIAAHRGVFILIGPYVGHGTRTAGDGSREASVLASVTADVRNAGDRYLQCLRFSDFHRCRSRAFLRVENRHLVFARGEIHSRSGYLSVWVVPCVAIARTLRTAGDGHGHRTVTQAVTADVRDVCFQDLCLQGSIRLRDIEVTDCNAVVIIILRTTAVVACRQFRGECIRSIQSDRIAVVLEYGRAIRRLDSETERTVVAFGYRSSSRSGRLAVAVHVRPFDVTLDVRRFLHFNRCDQVFAVEGCSGKNVACIDIVESRSESVEFRTGLVGQRSRRALLAVCILIAGSLGIASGSCDASDLTVLSERRGCLHRSCATGDGGSLGDGHGSRSGLTVVGILHIYVVGTHGETGSRCGFLASRVVPEVAVTRSFRTVFSHCRCGTDVAALTDIVGLCRDRHLHLCWLRNGYGSRCRTLVAVLDGHGVHSERETGCRCGFLSVVPEIGSGCARTAGDGSHGSLTVAVSVAGNLFGLFSLGRERGRILQRNVCRRRTSGAVVRHGDGVVAEREVRSDLRFLSVRIVPFVAIVAAASCWSHGHLTVRTVVTLDSSHYRSLGRESFRHGELERLRRRCIATLVGERDAHFLSGGDLGSRCRCL